jgi:hypothetical protein
MRRFVVIVVEPASALVAEDILERIDILFEKTFFAKIAGGIELIRQKHNLAHVDVPAFGKDLDDVPPDLTTSKVSRHPSIGKDDACMHLTVWTYREMRREGHEIFFRHSPSKTCSA